MAQDIHVDVLVGTPLGDTGNVKFKPNNEAVTCTVILSPYDPSADPEKLNLELASTLVYLLANLSARPQDQFMASVEQAFAGGATHKLHVARPYDELAGLLDANHYVALATVAVEPLQGPAYRPSPAQPLAPPATPGPTYDRAAGLAHIRDNYELFPRLLNQTLPRALADPDTLAGFRQLRGEGWLDWQILLATFNVVQTIRVRSAGLLDGPSQNLAQADQLAFQPETPQSSVIPLTALRPKELQAAMRGAIHAVGRRRWRIFPPTDTPNIEAFKDLLIARYAFAVDDVPHVDLLSGGLAGNESLVELVDTRDVAGDAGDAEPRLQSDES
ncbi:hypothetical protein [Dactylosporangium darangshiense]|uniref:Uncharacterized protein n=1 Tax=Dactylosporangium darangshiense TaxID=579108 RepID=A0ABP8DHS5_9ACTN